MQYKAISALSAVAQHGSYTNAAAALGCSKAYLSEQVSKLEKHYGVQLVHRTTRHISLTPAGIAFIEQCNEAFAAINDAEERLRNDQFQLNGRIRIASIGGIMGEEYIAPLVTQFLRQHPDLHIELSFSSQNVDLLSGEYDMAIRFGKLADSNLVARPLLRYRTLLLASPDYLQERGAPETITDLNDHALICGTVNRWSFQQGHEEVFVSPNAQLRCGSGRVMRDAAVQGLGITHLPEFYVRENLNRGDLVSILPEWTQSVSECNVLYPPGRYRLQRIQHLVDFLCHQIQNRVEC